MKNIVITGGSSGVGFAIAKDLSRDNKVIIIGRDETKLVSSVAHLGPNVSSISADLSKRVGIDKAVEKINVTFSSVDVLIHSAGIMPQTADENIKNNLLSHYELTVGLNERLNNARVLIVSGNPKAISLAPICELQTNQLARAAWVVTHKTLLMVLLADRLAHQNTTVNSFFPGDVRSQLMPYTKNLAKNDVPFARNLALSSDFDGVTGYFFDDVGHNVVLKPTKYHLSVAVKVLKSYIQSI